MTVYRFRRAGQCRSSDLRGHRRQPLCRDGARSAPPAPAGRWRPDRLGGGPNRLSTLGSRNKRLVGERRRSGSPASSVFAPSMVLPSASFTANIFRAASPRSMTSARMRSASGPAPTHATARDEVRGLIDASKLPIDERGRRRAAARAEWIAAAGGRSKPTICSAERPTAAAPLRRSARGHLRVAPRSVAKDDEQKLWPSRRRSLEWAMPSPDRTPDAGRAPRTELDAFLKQVKALGPDAEPRPRPADVCARRHHEPAADLGSGLRASGRHVPRSRGRSAASISSSSIIAASPSAAPRPGSRSRSGSAALMSRDRLPRRSYPDRQGAGACAPRKRQTKVAALVFVGDAMEETLDGLCAAAGELGLLRRSGLHVPGGLRSGLRAGVSRDCPADARRVLPFHAGAAHELARAAARGGGLCRRRHEGARRYKGAAASGAVRLIEQMK